jgi:hypothetical protein
MKRILFAFGFLVVVLMLGTNSGYAAIQSCAIINGGSAGGVNVSPTYLANQTGGANEGCNVLITFNPDGSITTTRPNSATSYDDGVDDNMIGIVNNSGHIINSIFLSSATVDIFGFDGDGVCDATWTFLAGGPTFTCPAGGNLYGPTGVTFSGINSSFTSGNVNFAGGIASGSTGFFSLEGPVAVDLVVNSPEPSSLLLLGAGLLGLGAAVRQRFNKGA